MSLDMPEQKGRTSPDLKDIDWPVIGGSPRTLRSKA